MNRPVDGAGHMPHTDTLALIPGQVAASLELRMSSALAGCTNVHYSETQGRTLIIRNWPSLSSGEELLWTVLAWLNGHAPYPDIPSLRAHLDPGNLDAALTAMNIQDVA